MRRQFVLLFFVLLVASPAFPQQQLTGQDLLAKTIAFHDPQGEWRHSSYELELVSDWADGRKVNKTLAINNVEGSFESSRKIDESLVEYRVQGDKCQARLNGSSSFTEEEKQQFRLFCDRMRQFRDYHTYLLGLPMKLLDPGTIVSPEVKEREFEGRKVLVLEVNYEEGVGEDTWLFYIDPKTFGLAGYRFFEPGDEAGGEYIIVEGEQFVGGVRIPKIRHWYSSSSRRHQVTYAVEMLKKSE